MLANTKYSNFIDTINGWVDALSCLENYNRSAITSIHEFIVEPNNVINELLQSKIDYDSTDVSLRKTSDGSEMILSKVKVEDKGGAKGMRSPILWNQYKRAPKDRKTAMKLFKDKYYDGMNLRPMIDCLKIVRDEISSSNNHDLVDTTNYSERRIKILENKFKKQLKVYSDILRKYNVYDYTDLRSIYVLGNGSFHISINNDSNDELICVCEKTKTIDGMSVKWIYNGTDDHMGNIEDEYDEPFTDIPDSMKIDTILNLVARILAIHNVSKIDMLKKIDIEDDGEILLFINDGRMISFYPCCCDSDIHESSLEYNIYDVSDLEWDITEDEEDEE